MDTFSVEYHSDGVTPWFPPQPIEDPAATASNLTAGLGMTTFGYYSGSSYSVKPYQIAPDNHQTPEESVEKDGYIEFTVCRRGYWNPTGLKFQAARGGAGTPRGVIVRSSDDNYSTTLGSGEVTTVRPIYTSFAILLTGLNWQSGPVTFRLYAYTPSNGSTLEINFIELTYITASPFLEWNGAEKVPLTVRGEWNGSSVTPLVIRK